MRAKWHSEYIVGSFYADWSCVDVSVVHDSGPYVSHSYRPYCRLHYWPGWTFACTHVLQWCANVMFSLSLSNYISHTQYHCAKMELTIYIHIFTHTHSNTHAMSTPLPQRIWIPFESYAGCILIVLVSGIHFNTEIDCSTQILTQWTLVVRVRY